MRVPDRGLLRDSIGSNWGLGSEPPCEIRYGLLAGCGRLAAGRVALAVHSRTRSLRLEASRGDRSESTSGSDHGWSRPAPGGPGSARCRPERRESLRVFGLGLSEPDHGLGRQMGTVAAGLVD